MAVRRRTCSGCESLRWRLKIDRTSWWTSANLRGLRLRNFDSLLRTLVACWQCCGAGESARVCRESGLGSRTFFHSLHIGRNRIDLGIEKLILIIKRYVCDDSIM